MVTLGAVLAMASRSTIGKIVAMWLPIMTLFAQGYEHSIVKMFLLPHRHVVRRPGFCEPVVALESDARYVGQPVFRCRAYRARVVRDKRPRKSRGNGSSPES